MSFRYQWFFKCIRSMSFRFPKNLRTFASSCKQQGPLMPFMLLAIPVTKCGLSACNGEKKSPIENEWKFAEASFRTITNDTFEKLKDVVATGDTFVVEVMGGKRHLIVMKNQEDTLNDEATKAAIDIDYTLYSGTNLVVTQIVDIEIMDPDVTSVKQISYTKHNGKNVPMYRDYRVGGVIDSREIQGDGYSYRFPGQNYFKTLHAAFFAVPSFIPTNYTGLWFSWNHKNGLLKSITEYKNGQKVRKVNYRRGPVFWERKMIR